MIQGTSFRIIIFNSEDSNHETLFVCIAVTDTERDRTKQWSFT